MRLSTEMPGATEATRVREAQRRSDALVDSATAKQAGFTVVFVPLRSAALNLARVADRVAEGGHDVPADRVAARRLRSHANFAWFAAQADLGLLVDNTDPPRGPALVAELRAGEPKWRIYDTDALPELTRHLGP